MTLKLKITFLILIIISQCFCQELNLSHWKIISSASETAGGSEISQPTFDDSNWYHVTIPATVMAGLLQNGVYEDNLFFGTNLQKVNASQFDVSWWYRCPIHLDTSFTGKTIKLLFKGINYKANVWLNGKQIDTVDNVVGTFRYFEFDVTKDIGIAKDNALALEIFRPHDRALPSDNNDTDLAISFVDWAPPPPDSNMGLWREVVLKATGLIQIQYPAVKATISSLDLAHLDIFFEASTTSSTPVTGQVNITISSIGSLSATITVKPGPPTKFHFTNDTYPILNIKNPKLWWPAQMGDPVLQNLYISCMVNNQVSDQLQTTFGIRDITSELTKEGHRLYKVNGLPLLIRGAGWSPDLFQRWTPEKLEMEFRYMRHMNLNTVRLEGKMESDVFFDLADKYGILTMPGWCCCDAWQHWNLWDAKILNIAHESLRSQLKRLRIHPNILVFMYSSDELPPLNVEAAYLKVISEEQWPNPVIASAADTNSPLSGPSGVKMSGPYSWVPPVYWLSDTYRLGGAFGFLTEGGPGENPMPIESFALTVPSEDLWPMNPDWDWHCGNPLGIFRNLRFFTPPLEARYGKSHSAGNYLFKSQVMAYEGHRAMFEGYSRNKYISTGVIQWMLNNAWPEMIWHLYDYYLNPSGAFYATKKACEPVHIMFSYDDGSIWVVNSEYKSRGPYTAVGEVYDINGKLLSNQSATGVTLESDKNVKLFTIPTNLDLSTTYFLNLYLLDSQSNKVSNNFYWLSTVPDVLDWKKSTFYNTACTSWADFTELEKKLPLVELSVTSQTSNSNGQGITQVTITNPTNSIAFFLHLELLDDQGKNIWPIFWDDNYVSLLPNSKSVLTATYQNARGFTPTVQYTVFNNLDH